MKRILFLTLTILATQFAFANGGKKEFTKKINESFSVGSTPHLEVDSRFGQIKLIKGMPGKIVVDVLMTVSAKNQERADKVFDSIVLDIAKTTDGVRAETTTGNKDSWIDSWSFSWGGDEDNFSVDYTIQIPENTSLEIMNQHGDVIVETDVTRAEFELQFGDLTAENFSDKLILEIAHGSADVQSLTDASVEVNFGDFNCTTVNDLVIESQHSDVSVNKANDIKAESGFGDYTIGEVNSMLNDGSHSDIEINTVGTFVAESSFTYYTIANVNRSFKIENEHGDIKIMELGNTFGTGFIETSFGDVYLTTDNNLKLDITGTFMSAKLSSDFELKTKIIEDHDTDIKGTFSGGSGDMGTLTVNVEHGTFKIK